MRIGIFAGSFDPVHQGHLSFAIQALKEANLDKIYFLPEVRPRRKADITHVSHRVAMLRLALKPYPQLAVLELPDKHFSVKTTLPKIKQKLRVADQQLFLLVGSDVLEHLPKWPLASQLLQACGLIVAERGHDQKQTQQLVRRLPQVPQSLYVVESKQPEVSASLVRQAAKKSQQAPGSLKSINKYIKDHWLYSTVPNSS